MKPILNLENHAPVTRLRRCKAQRGSGHCGTEFTQRAVSESGDFALAAKHPETVQWIPEHCGRCERALIRAATP